MTTEMEKQILDNQRVLAKALHFLVWKQWALNMSKESREMRKELAKLAGEE